MDSVNKSFLFLIVFLLVGYAALAIFGDNERTVELDHQATVVITQGVGADRSITIPLYAATGAAPGKVRAGPWRLIDGRVYAVKDGEKPIEVYGIVGVDPPGMPFSNQTSRPLPTPTESQP